MSLVCHVSEDELIHAKRKRKMVTFSKPFLDCLLQQYEDLALYDYSFSYFMEDILYWVTQNEKRFREFIKDNYEEIPPEGVKPLEEVLKNGEKKTGGKKREESRT